MRDVLLRHLRKLRSARQVPGPFALIRKNHSVVMPGLLAGITSFVPNEDMDGRDKPSHDSGVAS